MKSARADMKRFDKPIVVALGGNAISPGEAKGDDVIARQFSATRKTVAALVDLIELGGRLLVTHGNGPQVGAALRRVELTSKDVYPLPLHICGADTQGGMGYMISQCFNNELRRRRLDIVANTIITTVVIDKDDPEFQHPTKPVGSYFTAEDAEVMRKKYGWRMVRARRNDQYRRVVPSPAPRRVIESRLIRECIAAGDLIVAGGGGGVPVADDGVGGYAGIEGVIDKDRTSAILAREIGAGTLVIATAIRKVSLNFNKPNQKSIDRMTVAEARRYQADGQFPPGSMGPKIEAAIDFLTNADDPEAVVIICDLARLMEATNGRDGTWIVPG